MQLPSANPLRLARRQFLQRSGLSLGAAVLASLLAADDARSQDRPPTTDVRSPTSDSRRPIPGLAGLPHHPPRAKSVIFLCQSGAPSQLDLFDYKPVLAERHGEELPESIRRGQRLTTMTSEQKPLPLTASLFKFAQHGRSGAWVSELMPHTAKIVDELCLLKSLHTSAINHDPGITFLQTGSEQPGRPSMGSWVSYGLGTENANLPAFVVMISGGGARRPAAVWPAVGIGVSARVACGSEAPRQWRSGAVPGQSAGRFARGPAAAARHAGGPEAPWPRPRGGPGA